MLLIIFLGLIANLVLFCDGCNVGTQDVKHFDFTRAAGTWYVLLHSNNTFENNFKCVVATYALPVGKISNISLEAYAISESSYSTVYGNATNWTNNAFDEFFQESTIWSGRYYVIATDYKRYIILKLCSFEDNQLYVYVAYRSNRPDKATVRHVEKELRRNYIDVSQLVAWPADHCQQEETSTEGRCSA